ncbi:MAG TPA: cysteine desulfurase family protein [Vicinamibacterales bacterium]|nr:cysteine desulfurase family protein [Vicinamibacterales bacterium]
MRIYLDFNATAPVAPEVQDAVARAMRDDFGNPSSVHAFGQRAKATLDEARSHVAALIGGDPAEIVFTSGGTESDNLSIRGAFEAARTSGRRRLVTSGIEHEAVLNTVKALTAHGAEVVTVPAGRDGIVDVDAMAAAVTPETALVSVMLANNEVGTIQPVQRIADICHQHGAWLHTDAVQAAGKIPVSVRALGVDLLAMSAHKFSGPKGIGALWIRRGVRLMSQATGGRQERNRRGGTENVPAIAGMGVAARLAREALDRDALSATARLRDRLERGILETIEGTAVNGAPDRRVPNTTNISFDGIEAESLLIALDLEGIAVSTGSACSSGTLEPSHVLRAMGLPQAFARNSLRFSLGSTTTDQEIDLVLTVMPALVTKLRRLGRTAAALR